VNVLFRRSFERDLKKIREPHILTQVRTAIEHVEAAATLLDVPHLEKISGSSGYYRIRIGNYRIGVAIDGEDVEFVRCLHRREIYRYFP
jgi:mRNA interferase RelE/StbE